VKNKKTAHTAHSLQNIAHSSRLTAHRYKQVRGSGRFTNRQKCSRRACSAQRGKQ